MGTSPPPSGPRPKRKGPTTPAEPHSSKKTRPSTAKVTASHVLVKHAESRRKASWKDPEGTVISRTTRADAVEKLTELKEEILSGKKKFEDVARRHSDCSSAKRGGNLGPFGRGKMQKAFEEAAFALKVGEISDVVDTESGVHIILRTA